MTDDRILRRIRALLSKAESTSFGDEAVALTAKAHELMAAHAIDRALVEARTGRGAVQSRIVTLAAPYAKEKYLLLAAVARASGCRAILGVEESGIDEFVRSGAFSRLGDDRPATVVGHEHDLDDVDLLFTSLLVQATNVMLATTPSPRAVRSFRRAFLIGFAHSVGHRLGSVRDRAMASSPSTSTTLPVLASRERDVEAEVASMFPNVDRLRMTFSNTDGLDAGRDAGHRADVGRRRVRATPALGGT